MLFIAQFVCSLCFGAPATAAADEPAAPATAAPAAAADTADRDDRDDDSAAAHACQAGSGVGVDNRAPAASVIALLGFATVFTVLVWAVRTPIAPWRGRRPPPPARTWTRLRTALCVQRV
ncbi:hypothetical protein CLV63_107115 [Murinocardiopsis flavida]|uniref:MYXO-CTERM domain-containing protein n=2 Tax=Murinocardiopsis flavida TaxID=645275 RepID=A0A2P8DKG6_9ACTN|nr:hypothetical protein CLV63_107115 [Murinocardiopsis flavida]